MDILITGGSGYIGSYLIEKLIANGHCITSIDLVQPKNNQRIGHARSRFSFVFGNVVNPSSINIDYNKFDAIIPLAAIVGRKQCDVNPLGAREINHRAIEGLIELLNPDQLVIFPQTNMGFLQDESDQPGIFNDNSELQPVSLYAETKILGEEIALRHKKTISLRLSSVFGVSNSMKNHLLLNFMVKEAVEKNNISLYEPKYLRSFVSLNDLSKLIEQFFVKDCSNLIGQKINVSDPRLNITKMDLAARIQQVTGCHISITSGNDPDRRNYIIKSSLLDEFAFEYESSLSTELEILNDYYRSNFQA